MCSFELTLCAAGEANPKGLVIPTVVVLDCELVDLRFNGAGRSGAVNVSEKSSGVEKWDDVLSGG